MLKVYRRGKIKQVQSSVNIESKRRPGMRRELGEEDEREREVLISADPFVD